MKTRTLIFTALMLCLSAPVALAQMKIGFVNAVRVMESAPQVDNANRRLEQEFAPRQQRLVSLQQEIRRMEERLNKDAAIMRESESEQLMNEMRSRRRDLKRQQDEFREDYNIRRNEELDKLQKRIVQVIQALAKEENYDFILSDGVVFASDRVDITNKVLNRLGQ